MAPSEFAQKTAIVTGGCGGLGRAIAEAFLEAGTNVITCDINDDLISDFKEKVSTAHADRTLVLKLDITKDGSIDELFAEGKKVFKSIDFVVNNAGRIDKFDPVGAMDKAIWDAVIALNLTAPALVCKAAVNEFLSEGKKGAIVNIGSIASFRGFTCGAAYTASKHGLLGLTKNTGFFYASKGIRCNAILPGGMATNIANSLAQGVNMEGMGAMRITCKLLDSPSCNRWRDATDDLMVPEKADLQVDTAKVSALVLYLCSDAASIINGAAWTADGGATAN
ncbi:hypothetical protein B0A48_02248 [Cryoendolithus antarcticus]|uniref:Uncharacterized protein n=1 Tax=Cryoendolithus antarcticus TaxID=1507870 RepID=A0A1V8TNA0_9PEZI|nr:hypothetical protein B0A48_02248 [Cryoendolithus antarcticus]